MRRLWELLLLAALCGGALCHSVAADWPQWRGPNRDGVSTEQLRTNWAAHPPRPLWQATAGTGFASIAVVGKRLFTMGNTNNTDVVWCLDSASGQAIWAHAYASRLDPQYYEGGPTSTPTIHEGHVYTISKWGSVFCLDAQGGNVIWHHDLWQEGTRSNRWGFAGSPLVWKDLLILNAGTAGTALRLKDGSVAWSTGTNVAGYASPTLCSYGGKTMVLIFASDFLAAVDPDSGRELWRHPFKTRWDTNNTDPLVDGDSILISSFSAGCELLRLRDGPPAVVYKNKNLFNHLSPGIHEREYLYAFNGEAKFKTDLRCLHIPSGEVRWSRQDPRFGSMIAFAGGLLLLSDEGELILAQPSPVELRIVGQQKILTGVCWTPPALANRVLYARNAKGTLVAVDLR